MRSRSRPRTALKSGSRSDLSPSAWTPNPLVPFHWRGMWLSGAERANSTFLEHDHSFGPEDFAACRRRLRRLRPARIDRAQRSGNHGGPPRARRTGRTEGALQLATVGVPARGLSGTVKPSAFAALRLS